MVPSLFIQAEIRAVFDALHHLIFVVDGLGKLVLVNRAAIKVLGCPAREVLGHPINDIVAASELPRILKTGRTELVQRIEINGRTYLSNRTPIKLACKLVGAVAVLQDITEVEETSKQLNTTRMLNEELNGIIETSFDGIYVTDGQGATLRVNQAYERITGIAREEVLGKTMSELVHSGSFDESVSLKVMETGERETIIQRIKTGATVMVTGNPLKDKDGRVYRIVTNVRDITELNRLRANVEQMKTLKDQYESELHQLRLKNRADEAIVARSPKMQAVLDLAIRLARVDSTVLIRGESGAGKEVVAEIIHQNSPRKNKPFIKINCAAIPEDLLESELFGYVPGAFTGAQREGKAGIFEAADGGTILLDEIGEISLRLQAKLLRVMQDKQIRRVGDTMPHKIDVRILASTNRVLENMIKIKQFREDLYYRLSVVPIVVPPLRERRDDVIHLIKHFLNLICQKHKLDKRLHQDVIRWLCQYEWPGNVRELENLIERLAVTSVGPVITLDDLPWERQEVSDRPLETEQRPLKDVLTEVERDLIRRALAKHGSTRAAAKALGVDQSTVVRKAQKLGLSCGAGGDEDGADV